MKLKKLTIEQLLISLDRLTRFKNTKEKYLRVFKEIIISNLIDPKLGKKNLDNIDYLTIADYASRIINASLNCDEGSGEINKKIKDYENRVFKCDSNTNKLLNNKINYDKAIDLIPENTSLNLKWLKSLKFGNNEKNKFPIKEVILVEGITEEILLPAFSKINGYDFDENGIHIIAAGGKNQVVKMYYKLSQELKLPIFVLLDKDAEDNISQIKPKLRKHDNIHLVSCGEFEDLLPKDLVIKTINSHFKNFQTINIEDIENSTSMVKCLENFFKTKGLHEFKKAEFAKLVKENIESTNDMSQEILAIIEEISNTNKLLDSKICS